MTGPRASAMLHIDLDSLPRGGAVIFPEATGEVPGLAGRLNPYGIPRQDCLYTSNIAINDGETQPASFEPGEDLRLTDAEGMELLVRSSMSRAGRPFWSTDHSHETSLRAPGKRLGQRIRCPLPSGVPGVEQEVPVSGRRTFQVVLQGSPDHGAQSQRVVIR